MDSDDGVAGDGGNDGDRDVTEFDASCGGSVFEDVEGSVLGPAVLGHDDAQAMSMAVLLALAA